MTENGLELTQTEEDAEVIVVNTCCFIDSAKEESINTIIEMGRWKNEGVCKVLIVTGCLAERYRQEILDEMPEVDAVLGTSSYDKIMEVLRQALRGQHVTMFEDVDRKLMPKGKRLLTTGGHYAYLKIAEGCDKHCTYCIIPSVRGSYRSVPMEDLIEEASSLAEQGVKELILVAQETTLYGTDLYGKKSLHTLIKKLAQIPGIRWIRVLYCYPEEIYDELIETMKEEPKFCHYLDLPIQHASDNILKKMGRRTSKADLIEIVTKLKKEIPDIILRTTLITGFPSETEEDVEEVEDFINELEFNRLGVFTYSNEDGTPASRMEGHLPEEVKEERRDRLMLLQQEIAFDLAEAMTGREMYVMVEGKVSGENVYVCRTYGDAPNVDGYLFLDSAETLVSGDFVKVRVTGANEYDLTGEIVS